jgi:6-phosphofructokinase 1
VVRTANGAASKRSMWAPDGFSDWWKALPAPRRTATRGLIRRGGTILGTTNRSNPFSFHGAAGETRDRSADVLANARAEGLDDLVVIGGDGSLRIASELAALGLPVIGVPKTIDNDLEATDYTFGFWTAIGPRPTRSTACATRRRAITA